jgi:predicted glycosyltransferase
MNHGSRLLIYSHDSFGLGHLRRCRAIAHHLVERYKHLSVLILSGSPIIGSFDFRSRVDFVRVPGVIKLRNGEYTSLNLHLDIDKTLEMRRSIIHHTAEVFEPDVFLVDKEPLGLRGEVRSTLEMLRGQGTRCVLGLRDVMDEPASLVDEWQRKMVFPALDQLYHQIWVYGLPQVFDPLREIPGMEPLAEKVRFTGYLRRSVPDAAGQQPEHRVPGEDFILVTPGGGGDGAELVDWVIGAYEADPGLPHRAVLLMGPFMPVEQRLAFQARAARDRRLSAITFEAQVEPFFERASAVVAMGGYNTFCEILSFGKRALLVPRTTPRLEQHLRAERAQKLGLVRMLANDGVRDPLTMAASLRALPSMPVLAETVRAPMLQGLERISRLIGPWLGPRHEIPELHRSRYA